jgi:TolB-like protein/Flp pilus assembly protein TadD
VSLFTELTRRNVFKVGAAYLLVAWVLIQVAATVAPQLDFPAWVPRLITFVLLLGFPVALVLAWIFDRTPEGVRVDAAPAGNKWMFAIAAVLVAGVIGWYWKGESSRESDAADARTIAVLPFVNMSGDPDNEYFSDGISEEILNVLAGTPELWVAARTSSFAFKGQQKEIPDIARELNVRMVLEGSVRKQDDRVRITAQLVDAQKGFHVWSQTYDRELKDVFAIQDEIARAIGAELKVKIVGAGDQAPSSQGTENLEAYDLYLRGLALWQQRSEDALWQAIELFERAATADPEFAQAYAGQALVYAVLGDYSLRVPIEESNVRARDFAERALALDPTLPEPYAAMGYVANTERRRTSAQALLRRAIALRPSFATAHQWLGESVMAAGDFTGGLASLERATALDPRSLPVALNRSWALMSLGRYDEARASCERVLAFAPVWSPCLDTIGFVDLLIGDLDAAQIMFERYAAIVNPGAQQQVKDLVDALGGRADRGAFARRLAGFSHRSWLDPASGNVFPGPDIPALLVMLGEPELALQYLERASSDLASYMEWTMTLAVMDPIRCDPRFAAVIERLRTTDPHAPTICGKKG